MGGVLASVPLVLSALGGCATGEGAAATDSAQTSHPEAAWPARPADARHERMLPPVRVQERSDSFDLVHEFNYEPYARFDPCRPVHVVVNDAAAPPIGDALVRQALDRLSRASGLAFVLDGTTDERFEPDRELVQERYGDRWAPVLIDWTDRRTLPAVGSDSVGVAKSFIEARTDSARSLRVVSGEVALNTPLLQRIVTARRGMALARAGIMHELAHVVGLGHVDDPAQLMYEAFTGRQLALGAGDRTGLAQLGRGPCFDD